MCGRYEFGLSDSSKSVQIKTKALELNLTYKEGEIFPNDKVLVLIPYKNALSLDSKKWGINSKSLLINARIETLDDRITYKRIKDNRCAIICNGFYEWKDSKKYYISFNEEFMYLKAIFNEQNELVILTKASISEFRDIHDRMPIIMNQKEMFDYLMMNDNEIIDKQLIIKGVK